MVWNWNVWYKNTQRYPIYEKQLNEVLDDVKSLGQTYLDVGCGKGRLLYKLRELKKDVDGLDLHYNNFDLLKDQWPDKKYDIAVCNLVLVHFSKDELKYVRDKIAERSKYVYIFDENRTDKKCCELVDENTHKYSHDYTNHFTNDLYEEVYHKGSENGNWVRYLFRVKNKESL